MTSEVKSDLEDYFKHKKPCKDDFFKEAFVDVDTRTKKKYLIYQNMFNDRKLAEREAELKRKRKGLKDEYFINLADYSYEVKKNLCSTNYLVTSYFDFPQKSLKREIFERKKNSNVAKFGNEEMTHLFYNILIAGKKLQENGKSHGDISPYCIYHTNEGKFKLAPHPIEHLSSLKIQQEKSVKSEPLYVSPQMLYAIKKRKPKADFDPYKADVFSFGLVLLEAGLLKSIGNIYSGSTINETALNQHVKEFETIYCENPLLFSSVQRMLELKEEDRADFIGLGEVIPPYQEICDYFYNVQHGLIDPNEEDEEGFDDEYDPNGFNPEGYNDQYDQDQDYNQQFDEYGNPIFNNQGQGYDDQYGNNQYGNDQYGNDQYGNDQYGNDQYGNDQYGNDQFGNDQYGNDQYGNDQYGNDQYGNDQYNMNNDTNQYNQMMNMNQRQQEQAVNAQNPYYNNNNTNLQNQNTGYNNNLQNQNQGLNTNIQKKTFGNDNNNYNNGTYKESENEDPYGKTNDEYQNEYSQNQNQQVQNNQPKYNYQPPSYQQNTQYTYNQGSYTNNNQPPTSTYSYGQNSTTATTSSYGQPKSFTPSTNSYNYTPQHVTQNSQPTAYGNVQTNVNTTESYKQTQQSTTTTYSNYTPPSQQAYKPATTTTYSNAQPVTSYSSPYQNTTSYTKPVTSTTPMYQGGTTSYGYGNQTLKQNEPSGGDIVERNGIKYRQVKEFQEEVVNGQVVKKTIIKLTPI